VHRSKTVGVILAKKGYGQFCPVSMAAELLAERWMPVIVRELLAGSHHFSDLRRGIPLISPATLSQRLRELVDAGVLDRARAEGRSGRVEYALTEAGEELRPIIRSFGVWGERWVRHEIRREDVDPHLLIWAMHRHLHLPKELPAARVVLQLEFPDVEIKSRRFWYIIDPHGQVDVCLKNPGHEVDLTLVTSIRTMTMIYLGLLEPGAVVRSGAIALDGSRALARTFPAWCPRGAFADEARHAAAMRMAPEQRTMKNGSQRARHSGRPLDGPPRSICPPDHR
jgi:DNA-binding HxlR family transcriptional regulator